MQVRKHVSLPVENFVCIENVIVELILTKYVYVVVPIGFYFSQLNSCAVTTTRNKKNIYRNPSV